MANDKENRIAQLSKRFSTHALGRHKETSRSRERHSFYIDTDLIKRLDTVYRDLNHELHPKSVNKSVFLETLLEHGLKNLEEIKPLLTQESEET